MTFTNVKLIVAREIRDQLRDRRTLFVIIVLPILLYPLLGVSYFQIFQFLHARPVRVLVVGAADLGDLPPLLENQQFAGNLFADPEQAQLLEVHTPYSDEPRPDQPRIIDLREKAREQVAAGKYDVALCFPADFHERINSFQENIRQEMTAVPDSDADLPKQSDSPASNAKKPASEKTSILPVPSPELIYSTANEKSLIAFNRLADALHQWMENIGEKALKEAGLPTAALKPFAIEKADVAGHTGLRGAAAWAKILPVMLLLWALTGAFYPAIDLCAGEKERGTLETLLCSPAERSEIVVGKLLTIMLFSMITAVLNLLSVAFTGLTVMKQFPGLGPPPILAAVWLSLALLPVAALFSAVCLALAAFARSSKEGQYYLMPVLLVTMPLVILPVSPGVQLNLGYSLIPVTGIVLLLRTLLEGNYMPALLFAPAVIGVTIACCLLSVRWAIDQFNSESVLFSGSDQFSMRLWFKRLYLDRKPTPTVAGAACCVVLILMVKFFLSFAFSMPKDFRGFAEMAFASQLTIILPTALLAFLLTAKPAQTLLLKIPNWKSAAAIPAAILLAAALHPVANGLQSLVTSLYPIDDAAFKAFVELDKMLNRANLWAVLLVVAFVPAICEELAFRGFILSGFRHWGYKWRAIVLSAFLFGLAHGILQQSLNAFFIGLVLGYLAVQSGSILPCMVFHFAHNALTALDSRMLPMLFERWPDVFNWILLRTEKGELEYRWQFIVIGGIAGVLLLVWFSRLPYIQTAEERLQDAIVRGKQENPEDKDISISLASMIK